MGPQFQIPTQISQFQAAALGAAASYASLTWKILLQAFVSLFLSVPPLSYSCHCLTCLFFFSHSDQVFL